MTEENQHWIPKFLIKNFSDTDGRVYCLNTQTDVVTKPPPKHAASDAGFNDFQVNGVEVTFEGKLGAIETAAAPILKEIIRTRSLAQLNDSQRQKISDFIAAQSFRTQAFQQGLNPNLPREEFGRVFAAMWHSLTHLSALIFKRKWALMVIEHEDVFYLGDHPVILQNMEDPSKEGELGLDIEGVEALMPVSPQCAIWLPCAIKAKEIIDGYELAQKNIQEAQSKKAAWEAVGLQDILPISERIIANSAPIYQAMTTGSAFNAAPEFVENLNYLQCMFSYAELYSNKGDFKFARRVFHENPQYKTTPKVRLEMIFPKNDRKTE